ncbi:MAG: hypothetical protein Q4G42_04485 [Neisseria sp.]|nr:hypothetical protein [Neisseria sp.]
MYSHKVTQIESRWRSAPDQVIQGQAHGRVPVPDGYIARDVRTGQQVKTIQLDNNGFAGLEMKTGVSDRGLKRSQELNYRAATEGKAQSVGQNAIEANLLEGKVPRQIYIIEPSR